jgi:hypothetical protein
MSTKKFNDTIGNRARDLPACRGVPQPPAPLRAPRTGYVLMHSVLEVFDYYRTSDMNFIYYVSIDTDDPQ